MNALQYELALAHGLDPKNLPEPLLDPRALDREFRHLLATRDDRFFPRESDLSRNHYTSIDDIDDEEDLDDFFGDDDEGAAVPLIHPDDPSNDAEAFEKFASNRYPEEHRVEFPDTQHRREDRDKELGLTFSTTPENEFIPEGIYESPKQLLVYSLPSEEILYGGIAGAGKSEVLIARALKFVHIPHYRCLILRKIAKSLKKAGGLHGRMLKHLRPWITAGIVRHDVAAEAFYFPSGAVIEFSYLGAGYVDASQGLEYTTVIIDELTQITKATYEFWWSRLRRLKDQTDLPVQLLSACNPGGVGNKWVVRHWKIRRGKKIEPLYKGQDTKYCYAWKGHHSNRVFIESSLQDNPRLDIPKYIKTLDRLSDIKKRQLLYGDWSAEDETRYRDSDFRVRWTRREDNLKGFSLKLINDPLEPEVTSDQGTIQSRDIDYVFTTVDVACSKKTGVAGVSFYESSTRDIEPSWTVAATWAACGPWLLLLEVKRLQAEAPAITTMLKEVAARFPRTTFHMEENGVGKPILQNFRTQGLPAIGIKTVADKLTNSLEAQQLVSELRVVLPHRAIWLEDWLEETTSWMGHPDQTDDQVDTLSNAAKIYGASPLSLNPKKLASASEPASLVKQNEPVASQSMFDAADMGAPLEYRPTPGALLAGEQQQAIFILGPQANEGNLLQMSDSSYILPGH